MISHDHECVEAGVGAAVEHAELMTVFYAASRGAASRCCDLLSSFGIFALIGSPLVTPGRARSGSPVLVETVAFERASEVLACVESSTPLIADAIDDDEFDCDDDEDDDDDWDDDDIGVDLADGDEDDDLGDMRL